MYSMVLMAALTTGTDMPDMGRRRGGGGCCGCYGGMAYGGCYGGGWGGGYGGGYARGGCYGGGWGGGCGGGWGGGYGGGRVSWGGGGWGGGYSGLAWGGGYNGGYIMNGISPWNGYASGPILYGSRFTTPMIAGNAPYGSLGTTQSFYFNPTNNNTGNEATIIVHLPANASLTIDGQATRSMSGTRTFISPPLDTGKTYTYTLRGELNRNGRMVNATRTVEVQAGKTAEVTLNFTNANQQDEQIERPALPNRNGNIERPALPNRNGNPANQPATRPRNNQRALPTPPDNR